MPVLHSGPYSDTTCLYNTRQLTGIEQTGSGYPFVILINNNEYEIWSQDMTPSERSVIVTTRRLCFVNRRYCLGALVYNGGYYCWYPPANLFQDTSTSNHVSRSFWIKDLSCYVHSHSRATMYTIQYRQL